MAKRINDKAAKVIDQALAYLQHLDRSSHRSMKQYAMILSEFYKQTGDRRAKVLLTRMDRNKVLQAGYGRTVSEIEQEIVKGLSTGKYSGSVIQRVQEDLRDIKDIENEIKELVTVDIMAKYTGSRISTIAQAILERAIEKCPSAELPNGVRPMTLINSAGWEPTGDGFKIGFYTDYAWYVHENIAGKRTAHHPIHEHKSRSGKVYHVYDCGGDGKFLELAIQEFFPDKTVVVENENGAVVWEYKFNWGWF